MFKINIIFSYEYDGCTSSYPVGLCMPIHVLCHLSSITVAGKRVIGSSWNGVQGQGKVVFGMADICSCL